MSGKVQLQSPDENGDPNKFGTGYYIGDGVILTAGHVIYQFNGRDKLENRDIHSLTVNKVLDDFKGYLTEYTRIVDGLADPHDYDAAKVEITVSLRQRETILIEGSGKVNSSDAGLVVYLDPNDMDGDYASLTSTSPIRRAGWSSSDNSGKITGFTTQFAIYNRPAIEGDSGGALILEFDQKDFVLATVHSATTSQTYANWFTLSTFRHLNDVLARGQAGNVSLSEPTNLIVGSAWVNRATGSFRADIMLGRGGADVLTGDVASSAAWGNDQLFGGEGNDTLSGGRGSDLLHGGDHRSYSGAARVAIAQDGEDSVNYTSETDAIKIKLVATGEGDQTFARREGNSYGDFARATFVETKGDTAGGGSAITDTLISIENITATAKMDTLFIKHLSAQNLASSGQGGVAKIDLAANPTGRDNGDLIDATEATEGLKIDLEAERVELKTNPQIGLKVSGAERVHGGTGDDEITGNGADNELLGGQGADKIKGGAGNDILRGGDDTDKDELEGGAGSDEIHARSGDVVLSPDAGDAIYVNGVLLGTGVGEPRSENPCDPPPPSKDSEIDSGTYKGTGGIEYSYDKSSSSLVATAGGASVLISGWRNNMGGIHLKEGPPNVEQAECNRDPLILDLNLDRSVVAEIYDVNVYFDIDNDGIRERVAWALPEDGLLAIDRNGDGEITSGLELFGTGTTFTRAGQQVIAGTNGFSDLAAFDSNNDLTIDGLDTDYGLLKIWRDGNANGVTDEGELMSLAEAGISSISLRTRASDSLDCGCDGTEIVSMSTATRIDGTTLGVYDAFLAVDNYDTRHDEIGDIPDDVAELPYLSGSGNVRDLHSAMTLDPVLREMVEALGTLSLGDVSEMSARVEAILLRWSGASNVPVDSRGPDINAKWLEAVEAFYGSEFRQAGFIPDPRPDGASTIVLAWQKLLGTTIAQLIGQIALGQQLLPGITFEAGAFFVKSDNASLPGILDAITASAPVLKSEAIAHWNVALVSLARSVGQFGLSVTQLDSLAQPYLDSAGIPLQSASLRQLIAGATNLLSGTIPFANPPGEDFFLVTGDDVVARGSSGSDKYIIGLGAKVTIEDRSGEDELWLVDLLPSEVQVTYFTVDDRYFLIVRSADGQTHVTVTGIVTAGVLNTGVEKVRFSDDSVLVVHDIVAASLPVTPNADIVLADRTIGSVLDGEGGNDILLGYDGNDTYMVGPGSGSDQLVERGISAADTIVINARIADVLFGTSSDPAGRDLLIRFPGSTDVVTISSHRLRPEASIEVFQFLDGTRTAAQIEAALLVGTASDERLAGSFRNDRIDGGAGNDLLVGGAGTDTYVFDLSYGHDIIRDAGPLIVSFGQGIDLDDLNLRHGHKSPGDLIIELSDGADSLTVEGQFARHDALQFHFSDGVTADWATIRSRIDASAGGEVRGTGENDQLVGSAGADTYRPGRGDDVVRDTAGDDTYRFEQGDGKDSYRDQGFDFDTVIFGRGIGPEDLRFRRSSNDLFIAIGTDEIRLERHFAASAGTSFELLRFDSGQTIDLAALTGVMTGTSGNDYLFDLSADTNYPWIERTFTPGAGDDIIEGSGAHDNFHFEAGFGRDTIYDRGPGVIWLGAGLNLADLLLSRDREDLILSFANSSDQIRVVGHFSILDDHGYIETINYQHPASETGYYSLTRQEFEPAMLAPTAGDDLLKYSPWNGSDYDNVRDGGAGNDLLVGVGSTYYFGRGYGHDEVRNTGSVGVISFGTLRSDEVRFDRSPGDPLDMVVTILSSGETLTVKGSYHTSALPTATVPVSFQFADGSLSADAVAQIIVDQEITAGETHLPGFGDSIRFAPGAGDQTIEAGPLGASLTIGNGSGHDTYVQARDFLWNPLRLLVDDAVPADLRVVIFYDNTAPGGEWKLALGTGADSVFVVSERHLGYLYGWDVKVTFSGSSETLTAPNLSSLATADLGAGASFLGLVHMPVLSGTNGNDVLESGPGNEVLVGRHGADTFVLNAATGHDIVSTPTFLGSIELSLDTITVAWEFADALISWRSGSDRELTITAPDQSASMTFSVYQENGNYGQVGTIVFGTGTAMSMSQVVDHLLTRAGSGDDDIRGDARGQTLSGGAGNDRLVGGSGADVYQFGRGDGHDTVVERWGPSLNSVSFLGNLTPGDLTFIRSGNSFEHLVIRIAGEDSSLTIRNQFVSDGGGTNRPVERFIFPGGAVLTWQQVSDLAAGKALDGNNVISSTDNGDVLDGGAGFDLLLGGLGNDVYSLGRDYDEDRIRDSGGDADVVRFAEDIRPEDVIFTRSPEDADDLLVEVTGTERLSLTIEGQFGPATSLIEFFEFGVGLRLSAAQVQQAILDVSGTSSADTITGFRSGDRIDGGGGNDIITGGSGNDDIVGGAGRDLAIFSGRRSDYEIIFHADHVTIRDLRASGDGQDVLRSVEDARFLGDGLNSSVFHLADANSVPVAVGEERTVVEEGTLVLTPEALLANDTDNDGDALTLVRVFGATTGTVWIAIDGNIRFRPTSDFTGAASFSYEIKDPSGATSVGQVSVLVTAINDAPTISRADIVVNEDSLGPILLGSDPDGDSLSYAVFRAPASGTLQVDAESGAYFYVPAANFVGTDSFAISVSDGNGGTSTAHYDVEVLPVNDLPVAADVTIAATAGVDALATVIAADADDAVLSFAIAGYPDQGELTIDPVTGAMTYRPRLDATGTDRATIAVLDPSGAETLVEILIAVTPATIQLSAATVQEGAVSGTIVADASVSVEAAGATGLVYRLIEDAGGKFTIDPGTGVITIRDGAVIDFETAATLEIVVEASDGVDSITARFDVDVVNLAPSTPEDSDQSANAVAEDATVGTLTGVTASALDPAGGSLSYTLTDNAGGRFSIDPVTGVVVVAGALHHETAAVHEIVVRVSDGGLAVTRTFTITVSEAPEILGTHGDDVLSGTVRADEIRGLDGADLLSGHAGNDDLEGGTGNDILDGGAGADFMRGGAGDDIYLVDDVGDVTSEAAAEGVDEVRATLLSYTLGTHLENLVFAGNGAFTGFGNALDNVITGGAGHDTIVFTQGGVDAGHGGAGNDLFYFGAALTAADTVTGGTGTDTLGLGGAYNLTLGANSLIEVELLALYSGTQVGTSATFYNITTVDANVTAGASLFVTAAGLLAGEQLIFNGMAETNGFFTIRSGAANDILVGGAKGDVIYGGAGDDEIYGLAGNDTLAGGLGADKLMGGFGIDLFRLEAAAESTVAAPDRINSFERASDKIDLSALDAKSATTLDDAFSFVGSSAFTGIAGQLRAWNNGTDTFVEGDINGDGIGDFRIVLTGVVPLNAADFVL